MWKLHFCEIFGSFLLGWREVMVCLQWPSACSLFVLWYCNVLYGSHSLPFYLTVLICATCALELRLTTARRKRSHTSSLKVLDLKSNHPTVTVGTFYYREVHRILYEASIVSYNRSLTNPRCVIPLRIRSPKGKPITVDRPLFLVPVLSHPAVSGATISKASY